MEFAFKSLLFSVLMAFLPGWYAANAESSGGAPRSIGSLKELTQELNQGIGIDRASKPLLTRISDPVRIARGEELYRGNCVQCHRENARGAPKWHQRDVSGNFPPPPLDGSAHTWHHPEALLVEMIRNGSSTMPSFDSRLSENDIGDIIYWFQSLWPDDLYQMWARENEAFKQSNN